MNQVEKVLNIITGELIDMGRGDIPLIVLDQDGMIDIFGLDCLGYINEPDYCFVGASPTNGFEGIFVHNPTDGVELFMALYHELGHIANSPEYRGRMEHEIIPDEMRASLWALDKISQTGLTSDVFESVSIQYAKALATYCDDEPEQVKVFLDKALDIAKKAYFS